MTNLSTLLRCLGLCAVVGCSGPDAAIPRTSAAVGSAGAVSQPAAVPSASGAAGACGVACALPLPPAATFITELCGNGFDDNGDGLIDDSCACEIGSEQRCYRGSPVFAGVGPCKWGTQRCAGDKSTEFPSWGACTGGDVAPVAEVCHDSLDNDCDGQVDEDCGCKDGERMACSSVCGAGDSVCSNGVFSACSARTPSAELCNGIDDDCDGTVDDLPPQPCSNACGTGRRSCVNGSWTSCDADLPAAESCNGQDDDCDGVIDNVADRACTSSCGSGRQRCVNSVWSSCNAPAPGAETCNGIDDDCDGTIDDIADQACSSACGSGTRSCEGGRWSSCSAGEPKTETCNGSDDDCDGIPDDGLVTGLSFVNRCSQSRVFIAFGGCNACADSCNGYWVGPGESFDYPIETYTCITASAFAETISDSRGCLTQNEAGEEIGETRQFCAYTCDVQRISMRVVGGDGC